MQFTKREKRIRRANRIQVVGSSECPRLCIYRSNTNIYAQIIDDAAGVTIVAANDIKMDKGTKTQNAAKVGEEIAKLAKSKKIEKVVFDRAGFAYHGRVKALAEGARQAGLVF